MRLNSNVGKFNLWSLSLYLVLCLSYPGSVEQSLGQDQKLFQNL